jgi:hypothetical protein
MQLKIVRPSQLLRDSKAGRGRKEKGNLEDLEDL